MNPNPHYNLVGIVATALLLVGLTAGLAQDTTLWYRGYFDGYVTIKAAPVPGYYYRPSRPTAYPLNEWQYSFPLPCTTCGYYHPPKGFCKELGRVCEGNGAHFDPDLVYRPMNSPLPGEYYYEKQDHWTWRSSLNMGWPYLKYNQRTEPSGAIPMGRQLEQRLWGRRWP